MNTWTPAATVNKQPASARTPGGGGGGRDAAAFMLLNVHGGEMAY